MNTTNFRASGLLHASYFTKLAQFRITSVLAILCIGAISIFLPTNYIQAETHVGYSVLGKDTVWDKTGSPYILDESIVVPAGITLTIDPGVKVLTNTIRNTYPMITVNKGSLIVKGESMDRVTVDGIWGIAVKDGMVDIMNTDIMNMSLMTISKSFGNIATSTFSKNFNALMIKDGVVKIWGSRFTDNYYGIDVSSYSTPLLMMGGDYSGEIGGIGNALDASQLDSILNISNSVIANNSYKGLSNTSTSIVYAVNNWWGNADGPSSVGPNRVTGSIVVAPWLTKEPVFDFKEEALKCCSSIMFLPGIEGSYLYRPEALPLGLGSMTNTLWLPNRNDDVRKLFLDQNGSSTDPTIYSGEPIANAFGLFSVYGKFMSFLDGLTKDGTVNEWKPFAYDWRKPIAEVVAGPERKATTTDYLIQNVEELASRSKTGKVTLIAHSNGGLVAKYLVKTLEEMGRSDLIDSVISVGVPYLGTPQAIGSMLHGDDQSIGFGILLSQAVARQLGMNMSSAYSLLPSAEYFAQMLSPTIVFASSTVSGVNNGSYPKNIQSGADQLAFINDSNNVRTQPVPSDTTLPNIGNKILSIAAEALHSVLDPYSWPVNIVRWAIVGWNANTTKSINYYNQVECKKSPSLPSCKTFLAHNASTTLMGDGTVVAKSAAYEAGKVAAVDLAGISSAENSNIAHSNILESKATQDAILGMIKSGGNGGTGISSGGGENSANGTVGNIDGGNVGQISFPLPTGMAWGEPDPSKDISNAELVISTHSPVDLHIYDENGNHTGIIPNPTGEDIEDGLYTFFEAKIPGSSFKQQEQNESESDTYISLPDNGKKYSVVVQGTGVGEFTLDVERQKDGVVLDHVEYSNLPVTPLMVASTSLIVAPLGSQSSSDTQSPLSAPFASSSQPLQIDVDGNGSPDIQAIGGIDYNSASFDWVNYLETLKKTVVNLSGNNSKTNNLVNRISNIQKMLQKGKLKQVRDLSVKLEKKIGHKKLGGMSQADKQQIVDMIEVFIAQYE